MVSPTKVGVYGVVKEDNEQFMHDIVYVAAVVCPPPHATWPSDSTVSSDAMWYRLCLASCAQHR